MTGGTEVIKLIGISKTYYTKDSAVEAIKDINLHIEKGDIFGIIGLSGAGKSTLVRCINYLEKPTAGEVVFDGQVLGALTHKELLKARQSISMIFQGHKSCFRISLKRRTMFWRVTPSVTCLRVPR